MSHLDELEAADPLLAQETSDLSDEQREWLEQDLELRRRARDLSRELGYDETDIYHQLKQLRRSPVERLRRGLSHGRRRPTIPDAG